MFMPEDDLSKLFEIYLALCTVHTKKKLDIKDHTWIGLLVPTYLHNIFFFSIYQHYKHNYNTNN